MEFIKHFFRFLKILWILLRYNIDGLILEHFYSRRLKIIHALFFPFRKNKKTYTRADSLRYALEALGPIFVKFGQVLSTRRDLLPPDIALSLAYLQDKVTPFSIEVFKQTLYETYGGPIEQFLDNLDPIPLGSASIAQVHAAKLKTGEDIIVKVLRPNIHTQVQQDLDVMEMLAHFAQKWVPATRRFKPLEVVDEFKRTLIDELDMLREAANASQLRRNFEGYKGMYVPKIYWNLCRENILVQERVWGININNITALHAAGCNMKKLAELGVEIFFTQVFRDSFFHADMHPGNVFVNVDDPQNPVYIAVDFGIMGSLQSIDIHYLAENFLAFFDQDYRRVAQLHIDSGWVPSHTRVTEFESAIRTVCEPIFGLPIKDISFGQTLIRLFQTARKFDMPVQPQLILLQKTLLVIEGVGRDLYPELDLWTTAKPFLKKWMKERISLKNSLKQLKYQLPNYIDELPLLPLRINHLLTKAEKQLSIKSNHHTHHTDTFSACVITITLLGTGIYLLSFSAFFNLAAPFAGAVLACWGILKLVRL